MTRARPNPPHTGGTSLPPTSPPPAPGGPAPASWASGSVAAPGLTGGPAARPPDGLCAPVPAPPRSPPASLHSGPSPERLHVLPYSAQWFVRPINSLCSCVRASCSPHGQACGHAQATPHHTCPHVHLRAGPAPSVSLGGSVPLVPDRQQHTRGPGHTQATARTGHGPAPGQSAPRDPHSPPLALSTDWPVAGGASAGCSFVPPSTCNCFYSLYTRADRLSFVTCGRV